MQQHPEQKPAMERKSESTALCSTPQDTETSQFITASMQWKYHESDCLFLMTVLLTALQTQPRSTKKLVFRKTPIHSGVYLRLHIQRTLLLRIILKSAWPLRTYKPTAPSCTASFMQMFICCLLAFAAPTTVYITTPASASQGVKLLQTGQNINAVASTLHPTK